MFAKDITAGQNKETCKENVIHFTCGGKQMAPVANKKREEKSETISRKDEKNAGHKMWRLRVTSATAARRGESNTEYRRLGFLMVRGVQTVCIGSSGKTKVPVLQGDKHEA